MASQRRKWYTVVGGQNLKTLLPKPLSRICRAFYILFQVMALGKRRFRFRFGKRGCKLQGLSRDIPLTLFFPLNGSLLLHLTSQRPVNRLRSN